MQKNQAAPKAKSQKQNEKQNPKQTQKQAVAAKFEIPAELQNQPMDAVTINKKAERVFEFVRDLTNFGLFMKGVTEVKRLSDTRFRWTYGDQMASPIQFETEIVQQIPGSLIRWETVEGSAVKFAATFVVTQAPAGRGTVVQMLMTDSLTKSQYREIFEDLTSEMPELSAHTNLRRLKSYLECGEVPTTDGQPTGREVAQTTKH